MGFLYVRSDLISKLEPPFLDLHAATWTSPNDYQIRSDARRFENWETNYSARAGLGAAVDYALALGPVQTWQRIQTLGALLRSALSSIPGVAAHDLGRTQCGIVSFSLEGWDAEALRTELTHRKFNVSVAHAEHTLLDMSERDIQTCIRASVHYYNSEKEIEDFCGTIEALRRK